MTIYPLVFSVFWSYSFWYVLGSKFTFGEWHTLSELLPMLSLNFFYLLDFSFTLSMQDTNKFTSVFSIYEHNRLFWLIITKIIEMWKESYEKDYLVKLRLFCIYSTKEINNSEIVAFIGLFKVIKYFKG